MNMNIIICFRIFLLFLLLSFVYCLCSKFIKKYRKTKFYISDSKKHWKIAIKNQEDRDSERKLLDLLEDNEE